VSFPRIRIPPVRPVLLNRAGHSVHIFEYRFWACWLSEFSGQIAGTSGRPIEQALPVLSKRKLERTLYHGPIQT
jgi:hypothetical protein